MNVAIIPARGGSKGIKGKNLKPFKGRPLIVHSIQHALQATTVDAVYVTTDDDDIATVSRDAGARVIERPSELAGDSATSESALLHALAQIRAGHLEPEPVSLIVFLQATSPLRTPQDIDAAVAEMARSGADSVVSVSPSHRFLWTRNSAGEAEALNYDWRARPRRQDMSPQFVENGSIYLVTPKILEAQNNRLGGRIALHVMDERAALELDTEADWVMLEALADLETEP
jgi:N-acylneuraminate cytidylyltransferase